MTSTAPQRVYRVLLVEDNSTQSVLVKTVLKTVSANGGGFELTCVDALAPAIESVKEYAYEAILLDLTLPDSNGVETVARLRQHCANVPILVLTATDDESVGLDALQSGAQDYLIKDETYPKLLKRAITYAIYRAQSETALRDARSVAEMASAAKSTFMASMSHEFRTPLNAVLGFCQLLKSESRLGETEREYASIIENAGEHLLNLINDTLDFAKIEAGQVNLEALPVNLSVLSKECEALLSPLASARSITIDNKIVGSLPAALGDRSRLKQVILNLLGNAIKYNHEAGAITLDARHADDWLLFTVTDTGPGILPEFHDKVFLPFARVDDSDNTEGSGIGLAVVRELAERMGGTIQLESVAGQGTTFTLTMPVAPERADDIEAFSQYETHYDGGYKLLYIEDNPVNLSLIERVVQRVPGATFIGAESAEKGLITARSEEPDIIIMDINLPGMNGIEALKAIQADPALRHIPVIALTANALPHAIESGMRAGFERYLTKPVNLTAFLDTVEQTLKTANWTPVK